LIKSGESSHCNKFAAVARANGSKLLVGVGVSRVLDAAACKSVSVSADSAPYVVENLIAAAAEPDLSHSMFSRAGKLETKLHQPCSITIYLFSLSSGNR
jgi:hypothetical protein